MFERFESALVHVVLIAFREKETAEDRQRALLTYQALGEQCGGREAGILFWQVEKNLDQRKNWNLIELAVFRDKEALQRFRAHPEHVAAGEWLRQIADWVVGSRRHRNVAGRLG